MMQLVRLLVTLLTVQMSYAAEHSVGSSRIRIDLPKNYRECSELGPNAAIVIKGWLSSADYSVLVCFVNESDIAAVKSGRGALTEYGLVEVQTAMVREYFGATEIRDLCDAAKRQSVGGERSDAVLAAQVDDFYRKNGIQAKSAVTVRPLPVREGSSVCSLGSVTRVSSVVNGSRKRETAVNVRTLMAVKGRLIEVQLTNKSAEEVSNASLAEIQKRAASLVETVVQANRGAT